MAAPATAAVAALASMPALPPPLGHITNIVDPPSQKPAMIAVMSVMIVLTLVFVSLRLYSSFFVTKSQGAEDCKLCYNMSRF